MCSLWLDIKENTIFEAFLHFRFAIIDITTQIYIT